MNPIVQQAIEQQLLRAAQEMENQIDAQLHKMDNMGEDDLETIRKRRIDEMKRFVGLEPARLPPPTRVFGFREGGSAAIGAASFPLCTPSQEEVTFFLNRPTPHESTPLIKMNRRMQQKRREWLARGHGDVTELAERDFFKELKGEERAVCHFYRESRPCEAIDKHLALLAPKHLETKFVRVHAEKAPFLTQKLRVWMLPTVAVILSGQATDYVVGLDELGGNEDFSTEMLAARLAAAGAIFEDAVARVPAAGGAGQGAGQGAIRRGGPPARGDSDEDSDFE
jgi:hypothetical protein